MQISSRTLDGVIVLDLDGGLGFDNYRQFRDEIEAVAAKPGTKIIVNLEKLSYLSSWGIGSLLSLANRVRKGGGDVAFANLQGNVSDLIHVMRLNTVFDLYDSVEEAAEVLRQREGETPAES